jgi:hypothetical protein
MMTMTTTTTMTMTELSFPQPWIENWAEFSGDRNPIHFDADQARRLRADDVIAHGMLVLLFVKEAVSRALPGMSGSAGAKASTSWLSFRSRLRQPVVRDRPIVLELVPRREGISFNLAEQGRAALMTGSLAPVPAPAPAPAGDLAIQRCERLAAGRVRARTRQLATAFPAIKAPWVAADAITFATFLETGLRDLVAAQGLTIRPGDWSPLSGSDRLVVQTRHDVEFDAGFFSRAGAGAGGLDFDFELEVGSCPPVVTNVSESVSAACTLLVSTGHQLVMTVKIGLMLVPMNRFSFVQE